MPSIPLQIIGLSAGKGSLGSNYDVVARCLHFSHFYSQYVNSAI